MHNQAPIPLDENNLSALQEKHSPKIDTAVGNDSNKQQDRLRLFGHDPDAMAAHYPLLQKRSDELQQQNVAIQKTAMVTGWTAFFATAVATSYGIAKRNITANKLIKTLAVLITSFTSGVLTNYLTERVLGARVREESKDLATAARNAYERELAPYMEDTEQKLRKAAEEGRQIPLVAAAQPNGPKPDAKTKLWADDKVKSVVSTPVPETATERTKNWADDMVKNVTTPTKAESYTGAVDKSRASDQQASVV